MPPKQASRPAADASTLGMAVPEDLRIAQWNMGLPGAEHYAKDNRIEEVLDTAAKRIVNMSKVAHIICLNELHPAHQAGLDTRVADHACLSMVGANCGDVLIWCLIIMS